MDKRYNGHVWSKTLTTNIVNRMGLSFCKSVCLGHFQCSNLKCKFLTCIHQTKEVNELQWEGLSSTALDVGHVHPPGSTLVCKICKDPSTCIVGCRVQIYYVVENYMLTRTFIHLGNYKYLVKDGKLRNMQERA